MQVFYELTEKLSHGSACVSEVLITDVIIISHWRNHAIEEIQYNIFKAKKFNPIEMV